MIVLGIDAAAMSGWGIVDATAGRPRLVSFGCARVGRLAAMIDVMATATAAGVQLAAIEYPYMDKDPSVAIKLGIVVGRWLQECARARLVTSLHMAQSWQFALLKGLITTRSPREQRKAAAHRWVLNEYHVSTGEDEADAICLATWRAKQGRLDALAARAG